MLWCTLRWVQNLELNVEKILMILWARWTITKWYDILIFHIIVSFHYLLIWDDYHSFLSTQIDRENHGGKPELLERIRCRGPEDICTWIHRGDKETEGEKLEIKKRTCDGDEGISDALRGRETQVFGISPEKVSERDRCIDKTIQKS